MVYRREGFTITTDPASFDVGAIHAYLSRSYWCPGIPKEILQRAVQNSLCFGIFVGLQQDDVQQDEVRQDEVRQIGFARAITDRATYAYLADVYVLEEYRGQGLAVWLMECIRSHPDLQGLRRFALATRDAHGLYRKFGFTDLADPSKHMEIFRQGIYE